MSGVLFAVIVFAISFLAHLAFSHLVALEGRERVLVRFMLAGGVLYTFGYPLLVPPLQRHLTGPPAISAIGEFLAGLAAIGFLVLGYVEFWSLVERSFSLRILIDIAASPTGLTRDDVSRSYSGGRGVGWMMEKRVLDLIGSGMVVVEGHRSSLTAKGRTIARAFVVLQRLFRIP